MTCPNCGKALEADSVECRNCGIILSKWNAARNRPAAGTVPGVAAHAAGWSGWLCGWLLIAVGAGLWYWRAQLPLPWIQSSQRWEEVTQQQFDSKVLHASVPVFVYFDADPDCRGGDGVFFTLQGKYKKKLSVIYVNAATQSQLADTYGVKDEVIFSLFRQGREVKRSNSAGVLEKAAARNNGGYSEELFLKELENFIGPV